MPSYKENKKDSVNINYLSKDFSSIKNDLINYTKTYFPNTYNDFNESSPGMMFMEMTAYVGDLLSFYIDQHFKEIMLPTATERKNVINIANTLGYKIKASYPAITELEFTQRVPSKDNDNSTGKVPDMDHAMILNKGMRIQSTTNPNVTFETLDIVDFSMTGSSNPLIYTTDSVTGSPTEYTLTQKRYAISSTTKTKTFSVGTPEQFMKLTIDDTNVINIDSIVDSNNQNWYEVDYLAQDSIINELHYIDDTTRKLDGADESSVYIDQSGSPITIPVPYILDEAKRVDKRFVTQVNEDNTTSIIFGNGLIRQSSGNTILNQLYNENQQLNALVNGTLPTADVIGNSDNLGSLGELPSNTTLTVTYRVGGGLGSNVPQNDLKEISTKTILNSGVDNTYKDSLTVTNLSPARGGLDKENINEIKERAKFNFVSQKRAVTKDDYESLVLAMPGKYGNVAKVFVNRRSSPSITAEQGLNTFYGSGYTSMAAGHRHYYISTEGKTRFELDHEHNIDLSDPTNPVLSSVSTGDLVEHTHDLQVDTTNAELLPGISIFVLSYDDNNNLVKTPQLIKSNMKNYLNFYKLISDDVEIRDGVVVNFGVFFNVVAETGVNKSSVKLKCIQAIIDYFSPEKMKFNQVIYTNEIENILYKIDGVKFVKDLQLTQEANKLNISYNIHADNGVPSNFVGGINSSTYGFGYPFHQFYEENGLSNKGKGVILPPHIDTSPGVFELKNPNDNVKGIVE